MGETRKIIHLDMDAFYTSVEQRDRPELRGRPVVVGGDPKSRGVVAAASYEARKFGIRSAISAAQAYRLCPDAVFLRPDFRKYSAVSDQIHAIFLEVTPLVEPLSLDEAYLDVTENALGESLASKVARYLKGRIRKETGLSSSAGVGPNKFIAKIASDFRKPDGLTVIPPQKVLEFLEKLPVERIWGVGPATTKTLHELGLKTAGDIRRCSVERLERALGSYGPFLHDLANGIDDRPVEPHREPKSRGTETTFEKDIVSIESLLATLEEQAQEVSDDLHEMERIGKTVTLKLRYSDFKTITRSQTLVNPIDDTESILRVASRLLHEETEAGHRPVRLIGVSVSSLIGPDEPLQLSLPLP